MTQVTLLKLAGLNVNGINFTRNAYKFVNSALEHTQPGDLLRPGLEDAMRAKVNQDVLGGARGLAFPGRKSVWLHPNLASESAEGSTTAGNLLGRDTIAHEAFHANNPRLGESEMLARFYGGYRAPRDAGIIARSANGLRALSRYFRPAQFPAYSGPLQRLATVPGFKALPQMAESGFRGAADTLDTFSPAQEGFNPFAKGASVSSCPSTPFRYTASCMTDLHTHLLKLSSAIGPVRISTLPFLPLSFLRFKITN